MKLVTLCLVVLLATGALGGGVVVNPSFLECTDDDTYVSRGEDCASTTEEQCWKEYFETEDEDYACAWDGSSCSAELGSFGSCETNCSSRTYDTATGTCATTVESECISRRSFNAPCVWDLGANTCADAERKTCDGPIEATGTFWDTSSARVDGTATAGAIPAITSTITIEARLDITHRSFHQNFIRRGGCGGTPWAAMINTENEFSMFINDKPTTWNDGVPVGEGIHHVAGTYDGTNRRLYVDGVELFNFQETSGPINDGNHVTRFLDSGCTNQFYSGGVDYIRLWNVVRTPTQIAAEMNSRVPADTTGLVGAWEFDMDFPAPSSFINDISGNNRHVNANTV